MSMRVNTSAPLRAELYIDGTYHAEMSIAPTEGYSLSTVAMPPLNGCHTVAWKFYCNKSEARISADAFGFQTNGD